MLAEGAAYHAETPHSESASSLIEPYRIESFSPDLNTKTASGGQPKRCTPKHLFSPKLVCCSRCLIFLLPSWQEVPCPQEAGKVLQSLTPRTASKNKGKYPSNLNNLLEVEGGFAPGTNFIASQTVEGFWSWPVCSGENAVYAPCYLTLLKGNFFFLENIIIFHLGLVDKWVCPTVFTKHIWWSYSPAMPLFIRRNKKCFSCHPELTTFPFTLHHLSAEGSTQCINMASLHSHLVAHEGQVGRARPDLVHRLHLHSWVERYSSFCYADRKQQAVTQHPHCTSRRKTSEQLQKEKYVWVLIAQHVLCLVSNTAKKEVAFGQKASAHQQNALKAQLWGGKNGYGCLWWCDGAWWCMVRARRAAQEWPCPSVRGLDTWRDDRQYWSAWQTMLSALHQNCFQSAA